MLIAQVVGCHSENEILFSENGISNSESCSENTPELSESPEIGVAPGFSKKAFRPFLYPKDPAVLKTLRVVNHYRDSNSLPR